MIKTLKMLTLVVVLSFVMGCATPVPVGIVYTELKLPIIATANGKKTSKVGVAKCQSILGIVATGDASMATAKKNGGITKVHHVDWEVENILGIIGKYKITVYGE